MTTTTTTTTVDFSSPLFEPTPLGALPVEHLCDLSLDLEPAYVIPTPFGTRLTIIAKGGRLEGPRLNGEMLPGGGDWITVGSDGISRLDVRGTIRTDDDVLIHYEMVGVAKIPADVRKRIANGEKPSPEETYIWKMPRVETADERYAWLNEVVMLGYGAFSKNHIDWRMYVVL